MLIYGALEVSSDTKGGMQAYLGYFLVYQSSSNRCCSSFPTLPWLKLVRDANFQLPSLREGL